jgi:biopolymer transport protein ExbD
VIRSGVRAKNEIPTASMADISFLLFIFFVSTTIFRMESGLPITLPRAETVVSQKREMVVRIWVDSAGRISIQDKLVDLDQVKEIMVKILHENPALIVAFNADFRTPSRDVSAVIEELKKANAVRLSFTAAKQSDAGGR